MKMGWREGREERGGQGEERDGQGDGVGGKRGKKSIIEK